MRFFGIDASWSVRRATPVRTRTNLSGLRRLHLGPGPNWKKPDETWLSVDADGGRADIVCNFNAFDRLPLKDDSIICIYGSHVFEHVDPWHSQRLFAECHRVLQRGGIMRMVLPHVRRSIEAYLAGDDQYPLFVRRRERARKTQGVEYTLFECLREDFVSLSSQSELLGSHALAHQNAWDMEALRASLARAGFSPELVNETSFQVSATPDFAFEGTYPAEANEADRSLYVEARKAPQPPKG